MSPRSPKLASAKSSRSGPSHRGRHDELLRDFASGQASVRHPHGHRRLPRHAPPSPLHPDHAGLSPPPTDTTSLKASPKRACSSRYELAMLDAHAACAKLAHKRGLRNTRTSADYLLPLGTRMPRPLQNGLRRSRLHLRTPLPAPGTLLLSPHRLGDVRSRPQSSIRRSRNTSA